MDFDWRDYLPLAKAETSKFYRKQERGKFRYEDLLSEAVEALATSLGANYARVAIKGALNNYARDSHKIVRNIEMSAEEYARTRGNIAADSPRGDMGLVANAALEAVAKRKAERVRPGTLLGVKDGVTFFTPGPYRTNAQLLRGDGKASSKHGKVSVAIERTSYNDEWSQTSSGWIRARIDDDQQEFDPRSARMTSPRGGVDQTDYVGRGREQRFSGSCHNCGPFG